MIRAVLVSPPGAALGLMSVAAFVLSRAVVDDALAPQPPPPIGTIQVQPPLVVAPRTPGAAVALGLPAVAGAGVQPVPGNTTAPPQALSFVPAVFVSAPPVDLGPVTSVLTPVVVAPAALTPPALPATAAAVAMIPERASIASNVTATKLDDDRDEKAKAAKDKAARDDAARKKADADAAASREHEQQRAGEQQRREHAVGQQHHRPAAARTGEPRTRTESGQTTPPAGKDRDDEHRGTDERAAGTPSATTGDDAHHDGRHDGDDKNGRGHDGPTQWQQQQPAAAGRQDTAAGHDGNGNGNGGNGNGKH